MEGEGERGREVGEGGGMNIFAYKGEGGGRGCKRISQYEQTKIGYMTVVRLRI